ncbi:MAG: aspartate dehydrogenase [Euryarchaeota archaeon]|nr:aspartate dehydrogenase [Euryarchaeota archaeon]
MVRLALIGCGAIGSTIASMVEDMPEIESIYLYDRSKRMEKGLARSLKKGRILEDIVEIIERSDLVIEAASQEAAKKYAPVALEKGKSVLILSVGALVDRPFRERIEEIARRRHRKIYLASGAIAGIDGVCAAATAKIEEVMLNTIKPPEAFRQSSYVLDHKINLNAIVKPTVLFEGSAAEAVTHFPQNINVAAALSLAGIGFERTRVRIIADPNTNRNIHKLLVKGDFGVLEIEVRNVPSPKNPKTSYLAALSAVSAIRKIAGNVWVGV